MRTVILGARGQLGQEFRRRLPDAAAWDRLLCDVSDSVGLARRLESARPGVVLNCTSYNRVDAAEEDPSAAFATNTIAVRTLVDLCDRLDCILVHFSTNYVFGRDRTRRTPYGEGDPPAPANAYGVSKLLGEAFVRCRGSRHLVVRTAALFGPARASRHNFLENMLARAHRGERLRIVNDQTVAPTSTADLAQATLHLLQTGAAGLFHVNGPDEATWYELACEFLGRASLGDRVEPVTSAELGAAAIRPAYSVLGLDRYLSTGGPPPRPWREAVAEYWRVRTFA